jgi:hypothetical protein
MFDLLSTAKSPRISLVFLLLLALLCAPNLSAQAAPDKALLRSVDDHYNHLRTLRARYTEHYTGMGMDRTESGTLTLKKPGLMRWSYDTPLVLHARRRADIARSGQATGRSALAAAAAAGPYSARQGAGPAHHRTRRNEFHNHRRT